MLASIIEFIKLLTPGIKFQFNSYYQKLIEGFLLAGMSNERNANIFIQAMIPCFNGHYDHWSMLMKKILSSIEHFDLVQTGFE